MSWFTGQTDQILREAFNPFGYWLKRYLEQSPEASDVENRRQLVEDVLGGPVSDELQQMLQERSQGNPFFAQQLLHYFQENALLVQVGAPPPWALSAATTELPASSNAILVARIDRLAQEVQAVVETAAVLGREFALHLLARAGVRVAEREVICYDSCAGDARDVGRGTTRPCRLSRRPWRQIPMNDVMSVLRQHLAAKGYQGRVVPIAHLHDLHQAIAGRHAQGAFDEEFFQELLTDFSYTPPAELPEPRSLIVVAVPAPQFRVTFVWRGERVPLILPPTYVRYQATTRRVVGELAGWLEPHGHRVAKAVLPLKTLAVGSGLGVYGKNNICYVPGMGSFLQLVGCYTDLPGTPTEWAGPQMLPRCETCRACLKACPTGAIAPDRFLLHGERCLTFHNERHREFPAWIDPSWHHCLIGCMQCQRVCPEDKGQVSHVEEGQCFTEEETGLLLQGPELEMMPAATAAKVQELGLTEGWDVLSRNLTAILERKGG